MVCCYAFDRVILITNNCYFTDKQDIDVIHCNEHTQCNAYLEIKDLDIDGKIMECIYCMFTF